jgi:hypothetical protein
MELLALLILAIPPLENAATPSLMDANALTRLVARL